MLCVQYPYGARHGRVFFCAVLCGCVLPTGRGVRSEFILKLVRYIFRVCTCGTVFGLNSPAVYLLCVCVDVRGLACAARALYNSSGVRVCVRCTVFGMGSLGGVRSLHRVLVLARTYCACTVFWHGKQGRCTDLRKPAACTGMDSPGDEPIGLSPTCSSSHAVLVYVPFNGMDSLSNIPIVPACVSSHAVLVSILHLARTAGVMHRSRDGLRAWTRTLYLYTYILMAWTA